MWTIKSAFAGCYKIPLIILPRLGAKVILHNCLEDWHIIDALWKLNKKQIYSVCHENVSKNGLKRRGKFKTSCIISFGQDLDPYQLGGLKNLYKR